MTAETPTTRDRELDEIINDPFGLKITQQNWRRRIVPWLVLCAIGVWFVFAAVDAYDHYVNGFKRYASRGAYGAHVTRFGRFAAKEQRYYTQAEWMAIAQPDGWGNPRIYVAPEVLDAAGATGRLFAFIFITVGEDGRALTDDDWLFFSARPRRGRA